MSATQTQFREQAIGLQGRVDKTANAIRGVKIIGLSSKNGREYLPQALRDAAAMYEGKPVNIDHVESGERRSYATRIGTLKNVSYVEGDGLRGDLYYNPQHPAAGQLVWDAENSPTSVGLSHDVVGRTTRRSDGVMIVEKIDTVRSVDLVADPATTGGLFEGAGHGKPQGEYVGLSLWESDADPAAVLSEATERSYVTGLCSHRDEPPGSAARVVQEEQSAAFRQQHEKDQADAVKRWTADA